MLAHRLLVKMKRNTNKPEVMRLRAESWLCRRGDRQRLIVPQGCPCSIVRAGGLNDRVRDGNGWVPSAIVTSLPACTDTQTEKLAIERWTQYAVYSHMLRFGYRARGDRHLLIVPQGCPCSIVRAGGLNDRVRDGNGWVPSAIVTSLPAHIDESDRMACAVFAVVRWSCVMREAHANNCRQLMSNRGGDEGTRTPDPLDANQMLSQLSYAPGRHDRLDCCKGTDEKRWACPGSNRGPQSYQDCALAN